MKSWQTDAETFNAILVDGANYFSATFILVICNKQDKLLAYNLSLVSEGRRARYTAALKNQ